MNTDNQLPKPTTTMIEKIIRLIAGLVLLAPAILLGLSGLAWPSLATFLLSQQKQNLTSPGQFVGGQNFSLILADKAFAAALTNTLGLVGARLLIVAIVPLILALAVNQFGRAVRWPVRLLFTAPLAMFAPTATALVWLEATHPIAGIFKGADWFVRPDKAGLALNLIDGLYVFGLACAASTVIYLAALRRPGDTVSPSKKPLVAAGLVGLLATAAITLQSFTLSYAMTGGGPAGSTTLLALYQFNLAFKFLKFGPGAAVASLMLGVLAALGLGAGLIVVFTGLRLELGPGREPPVLAGEVSKPHPSRVGAGLLLGVVLLLSVAVGVAATLPPLSNLLYSLGKSQAYGELFRKLPLGTVVANTVLPPLIVVVLQVPIAYLAALGIGAVRPLGRWSEVLLLPISPWLFVSAIPLSLAAFQSIQKLHWLNSLIGLVPPLPLSVPMVFALTLFFKGQVSHWQSARAKGRSAAAAIWSQLVGPSLPLVLLLAAVALLVGLQDLYWPLLVANTPSVMPINVILLWLRGQSTDWSLVAAAITLFEVPIFGLFFVTLGSLQCFYLDRLVLTDR